MCGIAGVVRLRTGEPPDPGIVHRMVDSMVRRGPDGRGTVGSDRAILGMRRLAIIDLESGQQPIVSRIGTVRVVMNGEIYSYRELRRELQGRGHRFRTDSDTEVLVHGYQEWGIEGLLGRLDGMYAFALHDSRRDRVYLARDRVGIKPLLYAVRNGQLYFSSSLSSLRASGRIAIDPDPVGVRLYLHNQFVPTPHSIAAGVLKLPAASFIAVERGILRSPRAYWHPPSRHGAGKVQDWAEELRGALADSVARHLVADVEVGLFLSGGLDSSIVLALMADRSPRPVAAFSIGFEDGGGHDETPFARHAAQRFGAELHSHPFGVKDAVAAATEFVSHVDEPLADPACLPTFALSARAARRLKVVLSGEGADELFGGYAYYDRFTTPRGRMRRRLEPIRRTLCNLRCRADLVERMTRYQARSSSSAYPFAFSSEATDRLLAGLPAPRGTASIQARLESRWGKGAPADGLSRALQTDFHGWLENDLMVKVDRMAMANSLEVRVPFLDHRVVELAGRMPPSLKRRGRIGKWILRETFGDRLGASLRDRAKHGFSLPLDRWLREDLRPLVEEALDLRPDSTPWLDGDLVAAIARAHLEDGAPLGRPLWLLIVLIRWFAQIREGGSASLPSSVDAARVPDLTVLS